MNPLISVIIPSHNSSKTISTAIKSMQNQSYKNIEIIIIDDNSNDDTEKIVNELIKTDKRIFFYKLPFNDPERFNKAGRNINAGYSARNYGIKKSKGEWITFQDSDDASLYNRIETQYKIAKKYNSNHVCIECQKFNKNLINKKINVEYYLTNEKDFMIDSREITKLAKKTKGIIFVLLGSFHKYIPFEIKTMKILNKLFFRSLSPYPASGNCPLVKREIFELVKFRKRDERVWPSFVGRGADRDFNFQVAETFKKNIVFKIPLYLWRT